MVTHRAVITLTLVAALAGCGGSTAVVHKPPANAPQPEVTAVAECGAECAVLPAADAPPRIDFLEPLSGMLVTTTALTVRGTASDDQPGLTIEVSIDGTHFVPASATDGIFELTLPLPSLDADYVTVTARASDSGGHVLQVLQLVQVDNVAPHASIDVVGAKPAAAWLAGVKLTGEVTDGSAITVRVDVSDGRGFQTTPLSAGHFEATYTAVSSEDDVAHTVTVEATDAAGHVATAQQAFRVDVVAPRVHITKPLEGQRFNAADLAATGKVHVEFELIDADPNAFVRQAGTTLPVSAVDVQTSPTDDGVGYVVTLEGVDGAGNTATESIDFLVDRVPPSAQLVYPADGAVTDARSVTVRFSEPMKAAAPAVVMTPATQLGAWLADRRGWAGSLDAADTVYTLTLAALTDDFGNPLGLLPPWHVTTRPVLPPDGAIIAANITSFAAAADEDGVLTVVAAAGSTARSYRADPQTGNFIADAPFTIAPGASLLPFASRAPGTGSSPSRVSGIAATNSNGFGHLDWWLDRVLQTSPILTRALIPTPAMPGEGSALGRVGFLLGGLYQRSGRQAVATAVRPDAVAAVDGRWEAVQLDATGFTRQTFFCSQPYANAPPLCDVSAPSTQPWFGPTPHYSHAITRQCSFHVYNDVAGGRAMFTEPFITSCRLGSCPAASISVETPAQELELASATATTAVGARRTNAGVSVWEFTPDAACAPQLGVSGTLNSFSVAAFRPVRIADRPALVWLDTSGGLRLFRP